MNIDTQGGAAQRGRALLFSGHMIDTAERLSPRFPPALAPRVADAIRAKLAKLSAGADDLAISSAACGSDILFAEAVLDRGVPLRIYLPFDELQFIERSVNFANSDWPARYRAVIAKAQLFIATRELGALPPGNDPFERNNLWMLHEAHAIRGANIVFICVWNGEEGDGPGGTRHMMDLVRHAGGVAHWIDIRRL
ncbi:MAG: hypothetical protein V4637_15235 [Pseudomonadota bacterium]